MIAQRWFLSTPEQYEWAPVGTEVWVRSKFTTSERWWFKAVTGWAGSDDQFGCFVEKRYEVKRWGTDADHARVCDAVAEINAYVMFPPRWVCGVDESYEWTGIDLLRPLLPSLSAQQPSVRTDGPPNVSERLTA